MKHFSVVIPLGLAVTLLATISVLAQQKFKSAEEAADALVAAARAGDGKAIDVVLGPGSADIVSSGDATEDENTRKLFVAAYDIRHRIDAPAGKPATLLLGQYDYPFAIPLVQKDGSWIFDTAAGRTEVLARRIGRNELSAIQVSLAYFDAQNDYADITPKADGMAVYAQRFFSNPGKKDGLYWPAAKGEQPSPIGEEVAVASARGYRLGAGVPYHGYFYKIFSNGRVPPLPAANSITLSTAK